MMLRLKMIIKAALSMSSASNLDDALECIIQQCVKCLNCDRASCFILDEQKGQLWSKVAKGVTGVLRLPAN
jgi:GAF domain-containing protein